MHLGQLVYFDSFAGLIPCKITFISGDGEVIEARTTARRAPYARNSGLIGRRSSYVDRSSVHVRSGQYVIH